MLKTSRIGGSANSGPTSTLWRPVFGLIKKKKSADGFTLIELVMTVAVLSILTLGVVPLVKLQVRRQKEQQLREALREMRTAIDQFHREAIVGGVQQAPVGGGTGAGTGTGTGAGPGTGTAGPVDPRVRVRITDTTIFTVDNVDRYPPDLDTLVNGVSVTPLAQPMMPDINQKATDNGVVSTKKKIYLREIPIDPMTGKADWVLRSSYDSKDSTSWGQENVFDVRSRSDATALNGEKYSDW